MPSAMAFLAFHQMSAEVVCEPTWRIRLVSFTVATNWPHVPVDEVVALALGTGGGLDGIVPLALDAVAMVRTLAHDHLADHAVGDGLLGLPPDVGGRPRRP